MVSSVPIVGFSKYINKCTFDRLQFLVELGVSDSDDNRLNLNEQTHRFIDQLKVYCEFFEAGFLDATKNYYIKESMEFVQSNSITEYLRKVFFVGFFYMSLIQMGIFLG